MSVHGENLERICGKRKNVSKFTHLLTFISGRVVSDVHLGKGEFDA